MFATALLVLATIAAVTAFTPVGRVASNSMRMQFAGGLAGSDGPELKNFDPLKLSSKSPEWVPFFREAELKHGRIAMLATLGWITADFIKLPGDIHQVSSFEAHNVFVQSGALVQILFWVSLFEIITIPTLKDLGKTDRAPGDFAFDPLGLSKSKLKKYTVNELKNGRLAMLAFSGIVTQAGLGHTTFPSDAFSCAGTVVQTERE